MAASQRASALGRTLPEIQVAEAWILYADGKYDDAIRSPRQAIEHKADCEGAYYLLGRALFAAGQYQDVADFAEAAIAASGDDYNVYVPIINSLGALGKKEALHNRVQQRIQLLEAHLRKLPEDARGHTLLANDYTQMGRVEEAVREANLAMALRPNDAIVLYNVACTFGQLGRKPEASTRSRRPGRPASRTRAGRAATPTSRSSTATRSSRGCTRRARRGSEAVEMQP